MAPKGRWKLTEKKEDVPAAPKGLPVLPVHRENVDLPDAICVHLVNYFTLAECERYREILNSEIDWKRQEITLNRIPGDNKTVTEPRLTTFMSDPGICYEYSKRVNEGVGWHPAILEIKKKAERALEEHGLLGLEARSRAKFNSAQMNRYDGSRSALGMHCDNEPDLLPGAPILSVSFGATRTFRVQRKDNEKFVHDIDLFDGSFLLMAGDMQDKYLHGVPAGGEKDQVRFNITFRCCIPRSDMKPDATSDGRAEGAGASLIEDSPDTVVDTGSKCPDMARNGTAEGVPEPAPEPEAAGPEKRSAPKRRWRGGATHATPEPSTALPEAAAEK